MGISVRVGVVISTKNRRESLLKTLNALKEQSVLPKEIIIVDDGSDYPLNHEIFDGFPTQIRTVLIRNEKSKGVSEARNQAILQSLSDYIAFCDDDDYFTRDKIEKIENVCESSDPDLIYHDINIFLVNEGITYQSVRNETGKTLADLLVKNFIGGVSRVVCRRTALIDIGLFDKLMLSCEDWELWIRFAKNNLKIVYLPIILSIYTIKTRSTSLSKSVLHYKHGVEYLRIKHSTLFEIYEVSESDLLEIDTYNNYLQHLLMHSYFQMLKCVIALFLLKPNLQNLTMLIISIFGCDFCFLIRSLK